MIDACAHHGAWSHVQFVIPGQMVYAHRLSVLCTWRVKALCSAVPLALKLRPTSMHSSCYPGVMGQPSVPGPGGSLGAAFVAVTVAADDISSSTESATSGLLTREVPQPMQTSEDATAPQHDASHVRLARKSADLMSRVDEQVTLIAAPFTTESAGGHLYSPTSSTHARPR